MRFYGGTSTADMASFFREYAQDLMLIEGIESRVKDAIRAVYADDDDGLCSAIATVTDRCADVRKKLPGAIRAYVAKASISPPALGADMVALAEAEKKLGLQERSKDFEDLTFDEFTSGLSLLGVTKHSLQRSGADLEDAVFVFPFFLRRNRLRESPVLGHLPVCNSVQVDIDARGALMRSLGGDENKVALAQHELDLVDGPVALDCFQVAQERGESVADAEFVADGVCRNVLRNFAVVSRDVHGLVVVPNDRFVFLCVREIFGLGRTVRLGVATFVRSRRRLFGEDPLLDDQAFFHFENLEENFFAEQVSLGVRENIRAVLKRANRLQRTFHPRQMVDPRPHSINVTSRLRIMLFVFRRVDELDRKLWVPAADAFKYSQNPFDVAGCHDPISFVQEGRVACLFISGLLCNPCRRRRLRREDAAETFTVRNEDHHPQPAGHQRGSDRRRRKRDMEREYVVEFAREHS